MKFEFEKGVLLGEVDVGCFLAVDDLVVELDGVD